MVKRVVISEYDEQGNPATGLSAQSAIAVTPSDSVMLAKGATRALYVGVAGDVSVVMADGGTAVFVGMSAGAVYPISVKRVNATNTTATSILAVY